MMRQAILTPILCAAALVATACTDNTIVDLPEKETSITISGREYPPTRLLWSEVEIVYPPDEAAEEGLSIRIMADGANVAIEIPMRSLGSPIDLASRSLSPRPGQGVYFTFNLSRRALPDEDKQPPGLLCRIVSWGDDKDPYTGVPYGGTLTVTRGGAEGEWIVEWQLTDRATGTTISAGYVKNIFEKSNS